MYRDERDDMENFEDFQEDRKSESHSEEDMSFYPMSMQMHGNNTCPYMQDKMMPQMQQMPQMMQMQQMPNQMEGCCQMGCQNMEKFESSGSDDERSDMYRRRPYYNPYYNFYPHPYHQYNPYQMKQQMPWWMYQK
ncbi:MAG TPA: hypothetical protein VIK72_19110 [Clostridiaceae bacterium]